MYTVIEAPEFIAWSAKVWSDVERTEFLLMLKEHFDAQK
jgi:hypothetical protein